MRFTEHLKRQLSLPLPGRKAQYRMAHAVRRNHLSPPDSAAIACVLALFYPKQGAWHSALIQRVSTDKRDRHSGQISFPGGRYEPSDGPYENGALREAKEEIGLDPTTVKLVGRLTELYIPVSNFLVYPFVAVSRQSQQFVPQPSEVQRILEVPLAHLLDEAAIQTTHIRLSDQLVLQNVPYYNVEGHIVWGATAMILSELLEVVEGINPAQ